MRKLLLTASLVLAWPVASNAAPPLPPALQPYVQDGRYEPGDYGWMRGSSKEATSYAASYLFALRNLLRMTGRGGSFADRHSRSAPHFT